MVGRGDGGNNAIICPSQPKGFDEYLVVDFLNVRAGLRPGFYSVYGLAQVCIGSSFLANTQRAFLSTVGNDSVGGG